MLHVSFLSHDNVFSRRFLRPSNIEDQIGKLIDEILNQIISLNVNVGYSY